MRRYLLSAFLCVAAVLGTTATAQEPKVSLISESAEDDASTTRSGADHSTIERMVTITVDRLQSDPQQIGHLFSARSLVQRAAERVWPTEQIVVQPSEIFHRAGPRNAEQITIASSFSEDLNAGSGGTAVISGSLLIEVRPAQSDEQMQKVLTEVRDGVLRLLESRDHIIHEREVMQRRRQEQRIDELEAELEKLQKQRRELLLVTQAQPREVLLDSIQQLQRERQSLQLETATTKIRSRKLQEQVARIQKDADATKDTDDIVSLLERLVDERQRQILDLQEANRKVPGTNPSEAFADAREKLLATKVQLAQAKSERQKAERDRTAEIVRQLEQTSLEMAVNEERLEFVKQELDKNLAVLREQDETAFQVQRLDRDLARVIDAQKALGPAILSNELLHSAPNIQIEESIQSKD